MTLLYRSTDESIGSTERRGKVGRIPDLSLLVKADNNTAIPFICKVETPSHMKNLQINGCQKPDVVKLCNMLKGELDHMGNIEEKVVYGLLVEGNECLCELIPQTAVQNCIAWICTIIKPTDS